MALNAKAVLARVEGFGREVTDQPHPPGAGLARLTVAFMLPGPRAVTAQRREAFRRRPAGVEAEVGVRDRSHSGYGAEVADLGERVLALDLLLERVHSGLLAWRLDSRFRLAQPKGV